MRHFFDLQNGLKWLIQIKGVTMKEELLKKIIDAKTALGKYQPKCCAVLK